MAEIDLNKLTALQRQFLTARDVSVPLIMVRTADPAATVAALQQVVMTTENRPAPCVQWDAVRGFSHVNAAGEPLARLLGGDKVVSPVDALMRMEKAPDFSTVVALNVADHYRDPAVVQALWNLRDPFKRNWRTLVFTQIAGGVPTQLEHDVLILDEALPGPPELERIIASVAESARVKLDADTLRRGVDAVAGLSAFAAEQAVALSLSKAGLNLVALRERHRQMIENTKGLYVWRGGDSFDDLGGLANFKNFAKRLKYQFGSVFWIDEIEKAFGGLRGDLTGITQDYLGSLLSFMQDHSVPGILLMGHPGTGKSALSKALGNNAGVPTIRADLGAMHGSLVGESQHALRHALKVVTAVSQGRPLFVATCNSVAVLPPEFVNRFKWRFFVDLPDEAEKKVIWKLHRARRKIAAKDAQPDDTDWNGREIEQCFTPDHRLLGKDLRWKPAAEFAVGDVVLGFDEHGRHRKYQPATIRSVAYEEQPVLEVALESGHRFKVTPDHKFLIVGRGTVAGSRTMRWERADKLLAGRRGATYLPRLLPVWDEDLSKDAGWLAGVLDGEGSYHPNPGLSVAQNPGGVLDRVEALLARYGVTYSRRTTTPGHARACQTLRVAGGLAERLKLLGSVRPERLVAKVQFADLGRMEAKLGFDRVVSVSPAGSAVIVKIATTTGTLVVDGYPHHNCCETAVQLECSLLEAATFVVPIAQSAAEQIELRRREAHGRYLSASKPGAFGHEPKPVTIGGRQINLKDDVSTWVAPGGSDKPN